MAENNDTANAEQTELRQAVAEAKEQQAGQPVEASKVPATNSNHQHQPEAVQPTGTAAAEPKATLQSQFRAFAKFGDTKSDGKHITLSQSDKWMKQAKVIDKTLTTTDTGIHFKKFKSLKISYSDYNKYLEDLAKTKNLDVKQMKSKLIDCGAPGVIHVSAAGKAASAVERLTDTSRYTGTHKERFDASGKGKGLAGRKNLVNDSGYVTGYHNKNTYEAKH